jgi:hypothetical protein
MSIHVVALLKPTDRDSELFFCHSRLLGGRPCFKLSLQLIEGYRTRARLPESSTVAARAQEIQLYEAVDSDSDQ